jgi:aminoglycoside 6'-N-acetyltransferase
VDGAITWRPVTVADFPLLRAWLAQPYVARWWNHAPCTSSIAWTDRAET